MPTSITELSPSALMASGRGFRAAYLKQQAGYTLGIAEGEGAALTALLPHGYLALAHAQIDTLNAAMGDKKNLESESTGATVAQDSKLRELKVWRRKLAKRASRAAKLGQVVPDELTHVGRATTVPAVLLAVSNQLSLARTNIAALDRAGQHTQALLDEGQRLHDELHAADAHQETTRLADLPESVKAFLEEKGRLYTALKVINEAGQELHAGDPAHAARFNLKILHRHAGASAVAEPVAPTDPAAVQSKKSS